jgi:tetratricopeptide (TPR) repeat protein
MSVFSEEIENEFKEMAFALEYAERGCWLFAVYNQASARTQIIKRLQIEINLPVFTWQYSEEHPYPIDYLRDLSEEQQQQRALVSLINTVDGGEKTIKSLDFNREKFAHYPHSLIFWVTEHERGEIARKAGHFWAQRRGTFDFSKLNVIELTQSHSYGVGDWLNNLLNIDNYQEALRQLDWYRQLLSDYTAVEQHQSDTQRLMAETVDKISYLLYYLGRYSEAIDFGQQALNCYQTLLGENDYSTIAASNNLALLYLRSGQLTETETLLEKTLSILKQHFDETPVMATVLNNLAELYRKQGKYAQAEPLHQQSLVIREKSLGKDHPDVAGSLNNLALLYYKQGKYAAAESLYKKSLVIWEATLNKNHPDVATGLNNLAVLYCKQGKYLQAEPLYQQSLAIKEMGLGKYHPDVANSLNNLAALYDEQSKYAEAEPLYQRSLAILEAALGKDHPNTKLVKANYEQLLIKIAAQT